MLGKLGLAISYFIAIVYIFSILLPGLYCLQHGCKGPGELDAFMPRLRPHPVWRDRYGFLIAKRHTTDQKKIIMVLVFLASCNYFRDCPARCNCSHRTLHLLHCAPSLKSSCLHLPELLEPAIPLQRSLVWIASKIPTLSFAKHAKFRMGQRSGLFLASCVKQS